MISLAISTAVLVPTVAGTTGGGDPSPSSAFTESDGCTTATMGWAQQKLLTTQALTDPNDGCSAFAAVDRILDGEPPGYGSEDWWAVYENPYAFVGVDRSTFSETVEAVRSVTQVIREDGGPGGLPSPGTIRVVTYRDTSFQGSSPSEDQRYRDYVSGSMEHVVEVFDALGVPVLWQYDVTLDYAVEGYYVSCMLESLQYAEREYDDPGDVVLVFSTGEAHGNHGLAWDTPITAQRSGAIQPSECPGPSLNAPVMMPIAYIDAAWRGKPTFVQTYARDIWTLHEFGHALDADHPFADCWTTWHGHATIMAATSASDRPGECGAWWNLHFHKEFTATNEQRIQAEYADWLTPSTVSP